MVRSRGRSHRGEGGIEVKCPYILAVSEVSADGNKRINYADHGGCEYIFYDHDDGFGHITRVQFCQLIGRKKDVFECLNESEWHACKAYRSKGAVEASEGGE